MLLVMSLVAGLLPVLAASPAGAAQTKGYGYISWLQGDARDVSVATTPGAMLEGGGEDLDAAWQWFLARAGYGDIVIICATCTDEYNPYLFQLHTIDSAQTLKITSAVRLSTRSSSGAFRAQRGSSSQVATSPTTSASGRTRRWRPR